MMRTVFCSDEHAPERRLTEFNAFQVSSSYPMRVTSDDPGRFHLVARMLDLAGVSLLRVRSSSVDVLRTPQLIRAHDPEVLSVVLAMRGRIVLSQAGRQTVLGARSLGLYDSGQPFDLRIVADAEAATLVFAHVQRALLVPLPHTERLLAAPLTGKAGVGALLAQFLVASTTDGGYGQTDVPWLREIAADLVNGLVAHHLDADPRRSTRLSAIETYVRRHLDDPGLSPRSIAAAHHISVSTLHRMFQPNGITLAAWIRRQRLERTRLDLGDTALHLMTIHRVAARWGFKDHATFTRAFRAAYGLPPSEYRRRVLGRPNRSRSARDPVEPGAGRR
ncbi:helix-turn-helix domain-containing protein [Actinomadura sp. LD22]|uniref:Helix-turn-helix domain-containing protein n=1 Tax=Actinomadura physcomitrii TaxID=2650748 RepID=A0A6I4MNB9_9ACTN|nr:helix-turn-helix domain-containing protein [Actinomadura physcomitrii]MWA07203.1 helix-turn-helix domain-containing protein [Actinomadura physcomitrii]